MSFVHETACRDEGSVIGEGTYIWHFCHIDSGVTIGSNCTIGQNVYIARGVGIGDNVKIQNNVSVYKGIIIEDDVFIGPSVVFTNVINPRAFIERKNEFKTTMVRKGASIGANATIICGNNIGRYAFVGAGSVVTKDVKNYSLVYGNPIEEKGWVCECGNKLEIIHHSVKYTGFIALFICNKCNIKYKYDSMKENKLGKHHE